MPRITLYSTNSTRFWTYKQPANTQPLTLHQCLVAWTIEEREQDVKNKSDSESSSSEEEEEEEKEEEDDAQKDEKEQSGDKEKEKLAESVTTNSVDQNTTTTPKRKRENDDNGSESLAKKVKPPKPPPLPRDQTNRQEIEKYVASRHLDGVWIDKCKLDTFAPSPFLKIEELRLFNVPEDSEHILLDGSLLKHLELQGCSNFCKRACLWEWLRTECPNLKRLDWSLTPEEFGCMLACGGELDFTSNQVKELACKVLLRCEELDMAGLLSVFWDASQLNRFNDLLEKNLKHIHGWSTSIFPRKVRRMSSGPEFTVATFVFLDHAKKADQKKIELHLDFAMDQFLVKHVFDSVEFKDYELRLDEVCTSTLSNLPLIQNVSKLHWWNMNEAFFQWLCKSIEAPTNTLKKLSWGFNGVDTLTAEQKKQLKDVCQTHQIECDKL